MPSSTGEQAPLDNKPAPYPALPGHSPVGMGWTWWWLCSKGPGEVQAVQERWAVPGHGMVPSRATSVTVSITDHGLEHRVRVRHVPASHEHDIPYPVYSATGNTWYQ